MQLGLKLRLDVEGLPMTFRVTLDLSYYI